MEFLRLLFGRRPADIEMSMAARDYLVNHIARLDVVVKSDGMRRINANNEQGRFPFASRPINNPPRKP